MLNKSSDLPQPQKLTTQSPPDPLDLSSTGVHSGTPGKTESIPLFSGSGDLLSTPRRGQVRVMQNRVYPFIHC